MAAAASGLPRVDMATKVALFNKLPIEVDQQEIEKVCDYIESHREEFANRLSRVGMAWPRLKVNFRSDIKWKIIVIGRNKKKPEIDQIYVMPKSAERCDGSVKRGKALLDYEKERVRFHLSAQRNSSDLNSKIEREEEILLELSGVKNVMKLITAFMFMKESLAMFAPGEAVEKHVMIVEYCDKGNLTQLKNYSFEEQMQVLYDIVTCIEGVHGKGYVHRDLYYNNLMIATDPDNPKKVRGRIIDFHLACELSDESLSSWGRVFQLLGEHLAWMPPETISFNAKDNLEMKEKIGTKSDIWALGATFKETLSDSPIFVQIADLVRDMMKDNPDERIDAKEVRIRLEKIAAENKIELLK